MSKWKNDVEFHESLRLCANGAYADQPHPEGYTIIAEKTDPETGFAAVAYQKGDKIVLSFRGTEDIIGKDGKNDIQMGLKKIPEQYEKAKEFTDVVQKYANLKNCDLTLTGHSLGGSLAQIMGATRNIPAVTFNAYGTKDILDNYNLKYDANNVVNYINRHDGIATVNSQNYIGDTYEMKSNSKGGGFHDHYLYNQQPITEQIPITPEELKKKEGVEAVKDMWNSNVDSVTNKVGQGLQKAKDFGLGIINSLSENLGTFKEYGGKVLENAGNAAYNHMINEAQMYGGGRFIDYNKTANNERTLPEQSSTNNVQNSSNPSNQYNPNEPGKEEDKIKTSNINNLLSPQVSSGTKSENQGRTSSLSNMSTKSENPQFELFPSPYNNQASINSKYDYNTDRFGGLREQNGVKEVFVKDYKRSDGNKVDAHWRPITGEFNPRKRLSELDLPELDHAIDFWMDEDDAFRWW